MKKLIGLLIAGLLMWATTPVLGDSFYKNGVFNLASLEMDLDAAGYDITDIGVLGMTTFLTPYDNVITVAEAGGDYKDLSDAIDAATAGDTVLVFPGTYTDTMTLTANDIHVIGMGGPGSVIATQANANVVDFNTQTGIEIRNMTLRITAGSTLIHTIKGTSGSCTIRECISEHTTTYANAAAAQPSVGHLTDPGSGAGTLNFYGGTINYAHTGTSGGTGQKGAVVTANGGEVHLSYVHDITIVNSGTALATALGIDITSSGTIRMHDCHLSVTDPDATYVVGLVYIGGTGAEHELMRNQVHVYATDNTGYGFYAGATATTTYTYFNHIHVTDSAGLSHGFFVGGSATLNSHFDDIVAVDGNSISGTFNAVISRSDGKLYITGGLMVDGEIQSVNYKTIYIDAGAMVPCTTNGAETGTNEYGGSDIEWDYFAFDGGGTEERIQFKLVMPEEWDTGTLKVKFYWSSAAGSTHTADQVAWAIKAGALADSAVIDAALGTARAVEDTLLADDGTDLQVTGATPSLTVGAAALGSLVTFEIFRDTDGSVDSTADDMAEDAWLFGVLIQYATASTSVSAW